jgi:uncharacterized protein YkwD
MRKPLVVVCVTTSVVLLAGAVAATTAGADTSPDAPAVAGIPGLPQVPADPDDDGEAPALPVVPPLGLPDLDEPAAGDPGPAADDPDGENPADVPQRPGGPATGSPSEPSAEPSAKPAAEKPAAADRPQQAAAEKPQQNLRAAAQRDVTPAMVSGSATAPVQRQVLELVNDNRRRGGCQNLTLDRRLIEAANRHAADMARNDYFAHDSRNGDGAGERVEDAGYRWKRYGENIARGQDSAYEVVDGWMHSPAHRENIMDCRLHQMGIGLAFASDRTPYWVQDFATPH